MSKLFDTRNGEICIGQNMILRQNLTLNELVNAGMIFNREIDMKTGWIYRATGPLLLSGHLANFSLGFFDNKLRTVSFAFAGKATTNLDDLHSRQNKFLTQELGVPDVQNERDNIYRFSWGKIASEIDPRGGSCHITISWG